jgi:glutamate synthase (NADPH/NADH) small chain
MYPLIYRTATAHEEGEYVVTGNESAAEIEALGLAKRAPGDELGARTYSVNTVSFHGEDGKVTSLRGNEVKVVDGRRVPMEYTDFDLEADLVLIALGFTGAERGGVVHELGVAFDERNRMVRDSEYRAQIKPLFPGFKPKVYVAGDNGRGQSLIVWAIAEGRACAAAVDADLMGETSLPIAVTPRTNPLSV